MSFHITVYEKNPNREIMFSVISVTRRRVVTWFSGMLTIANHILFLRHFKKEIRTCMLYLHDFREETKMWGL